MSVLPPKDPNEPPEITHCHHDGGASHYTMRPLQYYSSFGAMQHHHSMIRQHNLKRMFKGDASEVGSSSSSFQPMLHVRRDLHHKLPMAPSPNDHGPSDLSGSRPSGNMDPPTFLQSLAHRKRTMGPNDEPLPVLRRPPFGNPAMHMMPPALNLSGQDMQLAPMQPHSNSSNDPTPSAIDMAGGAANYKLHPSASTSQPIGAKAFVVHTVDSDTSSPSTSPTFSPSSHHSPSKGSSHRSHHHSVQHAHQHKSHLQPPSASSTPAALASPATPPTSSLVAAPPPVPVAGPAAAPPPRRTGFSIADIMRR